MIAHHALLSVIPVLAATALAGPATEIITAAPDVSRWRVGAGYAHTLGIEADFSQLGAFESPFSPKPLGGGINYNYDDGFVRVDSSDNAGNKTWNWSYENNAQYNDAGSGSIDFSITQSQANARDDGRDAAAGFEIFAYYDMGAVEWAPLKERKASWGFRGGLLHVPIDVGSHGSLATDLAITTDRFELDGVTPPSAPYAGSFQGPGPLLGDRPTRSVTAGTGTVSGSRELDVHLAVADFGTYLSLPLADRFAVMLETGISFGIGSGSYEFDSTTTVTGRGSQESSGKQSRTQLLPGAYFGLTGQYSLSEHWTLQCSGRYQYLDRLDFQASGSKASLSFDSAFVLTLGGVYTF
jgi:hypothetical protein